MGGTLYEIDMGAQKLGDFYFPAATALEAEWLARCHLVAEKGHHLDAFAFVIIVKVDIGFHK